MIAGKPIRQLFEWHGGHGTADEGACIWVCAYLLSLASELVRGKGVIAGARVSDQGFGTWVLLDEGGTIFCGSAEDRGVMWSI